MGAPTAVVGLALARGASPAIAGRDAHGGSATRKRHARRSAGHAAALGGSGDPEKATRTVAVGMGDEAGMEGRIVVNR